MTAALETPPPHPRGNDGGIRLPFDPYVMLGVSIFLFLVIKCWTARLDPHEVIYLIGSRRLADPGFLAGDFTWANLPPTSALFDHLIAPLWRYCDEFTIVNLGRALTWGLFAWSLAFLGKTLRLPPVAVFLGFATWLLWGQTIGSCGFLFEGFQVKSFSYPLMFFSIALAMRGQVARAGIAAGIGTAFHIVVGGWGFLALFLAMLVNRKSFTTRQLVIYLATGVVFILPVVIAVEMFHSGRISTAEQALMDRIYVRFAMPHCCDLPYFMIPERWVRVAITFVVAPLIILGWRERREAKIFGAFVVALILFFFATVAAQALGLYSFLKLYPGQLALALPVLFLFIFVQAWLLAGGATARFGKPLWALVIVATIWLMYERDVVFRMAMMPDDIAFQLSQPTYPRPYPNEPLYAWIRNNTPKNSVFITPLLGEFWSRAERAQVASIRHPPLDRRLIEWKQRLEAMNGFRPFTRAGFDIDKELERAENRLTIEHLARIRRLYGATHFVSLVERPDLADHLIQSVQGFSIYDIRDLAPEISSED